MDFYLKPYQFRAITLETAPLKPVPAAATACWDWITGNCQSRLNDARFAKRVHCDAITHFEKIHT